MRSYAIQIFFDKAGEQAIYALWDKVAAAAGTVSLTQASVPHLTLMIFLDEADDLAQVTARLGQFCRDYRSFRLTFSQAGIFPGREGVVYLAPSMTRYLLYLHRHLFRALCNLTIEEQAFYHPDKWVPHCTLTLQANAEQMASVIKVLIDEPLRLQVTAVAIGIDELPPAATVARFELSPRRPNPNIRQNQLTEAPALIVVPQSARIEAFTDKGLPPGPAAALTPSLVKVHLNGKEKPPQA